MLQHRTAFFEEINTFGAEESGGSPTGVASLCLFLRSYYHHFHVKTRPSFEKRASQYVSGLFQLKSKRNISKIHERVAGAEYQSLHHFLANSPWSDQAVCSQISADASTLLGGTPESCLLIDPSGIPKKGRHSVGVVRQYCGNLGKVDNCQVGVFAALAKGRDACLINKKLFLPEKWSKDTARCAKAGVPEDMCSYKTRGQLAKELILEADAAGVQYSWIGMDAEFGSYPWLLQELHQERKTFMIDVASNVRVYRFNPHLWRKPKSRKPNNGLHARCKSVETKQLRLAHGKRRWRRIEIRDSTKGTMVAEYLQKKVWFWDGKSTTRAFHCYLIVRRTEKENGSGWVYKYSLSNSPAGTSTKRLAYQQSQRFWIEQGIRDVKDGLGLDEYQIRKWAAWHHHVTLTMLAGLFVLKTRLENRDSWPLLSIYDVRDILDFLLPRKASTLDKLLEQISIRHKHRYATYLGERRRRPKRSPTNRDPAEPM